MSDTRPTAAAVDQTTRDRIAMVLHELHLNHEFDATADVDAVLAVLPPPADRAAVLAEVLPAWEAVYEPGNVSDYLIGYANDQDAATGMADAWMRSQAEVTGRLEWVDDKQLANGNYDRWFELIECHGDGVDTGTSIVVRRRLADEAQQPEPDDEGDELVCVDGCGFCDACGMEPFGTPAEGWREAARFLRRTARESGDRQGALHGARLIEAELRRVAEEARDEQEAHAHFDQLAEELPAVGARQPDTETRDAVVAVPAHYRVEASDGDTWQNLAVPRDLDVARRLAAGYRRSHPNTTVRILQCSDRAVVIEPQPDTETPKPDSPAYARLQAAAHKATEAAHLHAMHGMKRTFQLALRYGNQPIPAAEVLNALGLDENANTVEPAAPAPVPDPTWPRRAWDLGLLHKGGDPHHCPACVAQPEPPKDFICPGAEANAEVLANPQPAATSAVPGRSVADTDAAHVAPHCDGFPATRPNPVTVPPAPPQHGGGIRCGCYDEEQPS